MNTVLRCENLSKKFGFNDVLKDINFSVQRGELVCLIGKIGAGKSTLLNIIASIIYQSCGKVFINGINKEGEHASYVRSCVSLLADKDMLDSNLTLIKNLELRGKLYNQNSATLNCRIEFLLQLFDLEKYGETVYGKLSLEKRKRADFARALIANPKVLLIDEEYGVIERDILNKVFDYINVLRNNNEISVIMATKCFTDADKADKIIYMYNGKIMENDSLQHLLDKHLSDRLIIHEPFSQDCNDYFAFIKQDFKYENHAYYLDIPIGNRAVSILKDLKIKYDKYEFVRANAQNLYDYLNKKYEKEDNSYIDKLNQIDGN